MDASHRKAFLASIRARGEIPPLECSNIKKDTNQSVLLLSSPKKLKNSLLPTLLQKESSFETLSCNDPRPPPLKFTALDLQAEIEKRHKVDKSKKNCDSTTTKTTLLIKNDDPLQQPKLKDEQKISHQCNKQKRPILKFSAEDLQLEIQNRLKRNSILKKSNNEITPVDSNNQTKKMLSMILPASPADLQDLIQRKAEAFKHIREQRLLETQEDIITSQKDDILLNSEIENKNQEKNLKQRKLSREILTKPILHHPKLPKSILANTILSFESDVKKSESHDNSSYTNSNNNKLVLISDDHHPSASSHNLQKEKHANKKLQNNKKGSGKDSSSCSYSPQKTTSIKCHSTSKGLVIPSRTRQVTSVKPAHHHHHHHHQQQQQQTPYFPSNIINNNNDDDNNNNDDPSSLSDLNNLKNILTTQDTISSPVSNNNDHTNNCLLEFQEGYEPSYIINPSKDNHHKQYRLITEPNEVQRAWRQLSCKFRESDELEIKELLKRREHKTFNS